MDAVEVFNARVLLPWDNRRAREFALAHGIPAGGGSDAHVPAEIGAGYAVKDMRGSTCNDPMRVRDGAVVFERNNAGGVTGGLATGQPLIARLAIKPTPTIAKDQHTVDKVSLENATLKAVTRRDPTIVARVWPVAEAFTALVVLDQYMQHVGYQALRLPRP